MIRICFIFCLFVGHAFAESYNEVLPRAQKLQQDALVYFGGEGCVWCVRFEKEVLNELDKSPFILVKCKVETDSSLWQKFQKIYNKKFGIPALFYINTKRMLITKYHIGYLSKEKFKEWLNEKTANDL